MIDQSVHCFARGNTARGAHSLIQSAFSGLDHLFVLTGPPGTGKSTVIRSLADQLENQGRHVQYIHSPLRPNELDGLIVTEYKIGVIDENICDDLPEAGSIITFDFEDALDHSRLSPERLDTIEDLRERLADAYANTYDTYASALRIHDDWEKYYISSMDFEKADQITHDLIRELYTGHETDTPITGRHLFFGAATPKGAFDFIQRLTAQLERRIFIKGRPGSGKSTMLKKLAAAAEQNGIDVQIYHCALDPNSLDMLIFPTLRTAIFDSTAPHEYFPDRDGDEILDMYTRTMTPGTDEAYAAELAEVKGRYTAKMKEATAHLVLAESLDSQIKAYYTAATNFAVVEKLQSQVQAKLDELLDQ